MPLVPAMIVASGLAEGAGLGLGVVALAAGGSAPIATLAAAGFVLALVNAALWNRYRGIARAAGVGVLARQVIDRLTPQLHILGHAVPALLLAAAFAIPSPGDIGLLAAGGLCAMLGGALWKFTVITRAAYRQDLKLPHLPQRGSGRRAAPVRRALSSGGET